MHSNRALSSFTTSTPVINASKVGFRLTSKFHTSLSYRPQEGTWGLDDDDDSDIGDMDPAEAYLEQNIQYFMEHTETHPDDRRTSYALQNDPEPEDSDFSRLKPSKKVSEVYLS